MGGASYGYTAARWEIVDLLQQRSRHYLFPKHTAPDIATASLAALRIPEESTVLRERLEENNWYYCRRILYGLQEEIGFK